MKARFKVITAALALMAVAPNGAIATAPREPPALRHASVDIRFVKPVALAEDLAGDAGSREWEMLVAGLLGAVAIARRRLSS
jgi:hypothetical protein